ncbi:MULTISPECIES: hypothetical protein [unclassified Nostoc]|nr:hypothetical protein [Nostoc sp. DedQUE03]MDZ7974296.1 hypothetical protein [Nostoc sp. DedQUE03]MDZ8043591.1 hypothetical protein [Nostoc sp. DedQUE02]
MLSRPTLAKKISVTPLARDRVAFMQKRHLLRRFTLAEASGREGGWIN